MFLSRTSYLIPYFFGFIYEFVLCVMSNFNDGALVVVVVVVVASAAE
jgi:hypothetical protein